MNFLLSKLEARIQEKKEEGLDATRIFNSLKEYLQYSVLHFVYNDKKYSQLVMYGGTLLRICYGLKRMSEDLDFQASKKIDLEKLKKDLIGYFKKRYDFDLKISIKDSPANDTNILTLRFDILDVLSVETAYKTLKIRFDVNFFEAADQFPNEVISVTEGDYVFSAKTYTLPVLMASKVAAVFLRNKRSVGDAQLGCKPRDIFDLLWYMEKKIIPDITYLKAKGLQFSTPLEIFDKLELCINEIDDKNFALDLAQFLYNDTEFENWHQNWRNTFMHLRKSYGIYEVGELQAVDIYEDWSTSVRNFRFHFATSVPNKSVLFFFSLSDYWYVFSDIKVEGKHRIKKIEDKLHHLENKLFSDLDYEYAGLFYTKILDYLKRNSNIVVQKNIKTKLIRADGKNLDTKKQILLSEGLLTKVTLEELI